jgi:hypothetical protein
VRRTLVLIAFVVAACSLLPGGAETSTIVIVTKTTVPVSAEDSGSRRIVAPCSERTIEYHGSWGGDPESGQPVAEPLPSDAYSVSLESQFTRPFENPVHQRVIVDATNGAHSLDSMPELRSAPCAGIPPAGLVRPMPLESINQPDALVRGTNRPPDDPRTRRFE